MKLPDFYNYIAAFLTSHCCYKCSYCINWKFECTEVNGKDWINALNRIETDLSVTLSGGESSLHKDFYEIINNIQQKVDLLTNLQFNVEEFIKNTDKNKFDNTKTFAPIRVSFHSRFMNINRTVDKIRKLIEKDYRVGLYCVDCEENKDAIEFFKKVEWLDFQIKPLLDNTIITAENKNVHCRTRELIIGPDLNIFKCHRDLYKQENSIGKLNVIESIDYIYRDCINGNECHPCDLKIKRDRFGKEGYCAVEII